MLSGVPVRTEVLLGAALRQRRAPRKVKRCGVAILVEPNRPDCAEKLPNSR